MADYKEMIKSTQQLEATLRKCMQEACIHPDLEYGSAGDAGDGDKRYWVTCKMCGKRAGYWAGYDYGRFPLSPEEEKRREEYRKLSMCGRKT